MYSPYAANPTANSPYSASSAGSNLNGTNPDILRALGVQQGMQQGQGMPQMGFGGGFMSYPYMMQQPPEMQMPPGAPQMRLPQAGMPLGGMGSGMGMPPLPPQGIPTQRNPMSQQQPAFFTAGNNSGGGSGNYFNPGR